jgi:hypothetical protein
MISILSLTLDNTRICRVPQHFLKPPVAMAHHRCHSQALTMHNMTRTGLGDADGNFWQTRHFEKGNSSVILDYFKTALFQY